MCQIGALADLHRENIMHEKGLVVVTLKALLCMNACRSQVKSTLNPAIIIAIRTTRSYDYIINGRGGKAVADNQL